MFLSTLNWHRNYGSQYSMLAASYGPPPSYAIVHLAESGLRTGAGGDLPPAIERVEPNLEAYVEGLDALYKADTGLDPDQMRAVPQQTAPGSPPRAQQVRASNVGSSSPVTSTSIYYNTAAAPAANQPHDANESPRTGDVTSVDNELGASAESVPDADASPLFGNDGVEPTAGVATSFKEEYDLVNSPAALVGSPNVASDVAAGNAMAVVELPGIDARGEPSAVPLADASNVESSISLGSADSETESSSSEADDDSDDDADDGVNGDDAEGGDEDASSDDAYHGDDESGGASDDAGDGDDESSNGAEYDDHERDNSGDTDAGSGTDAAADGADDGEDAGTDDAYDGDNEAGGASDDDSVAVYGNDVADGNSIDDDAGLGAYYGVNGPDTWADPSLQYWAARGMTAGDFFGREYNVLLWQGLTECSLGREPEWSYKRFTY